VTHLWYYLSSRGFLIRLDQNILGFAKLLWLRGSGLGFEDRLHQPRWHFISPTLLKAYRVVRLALALAAWQLGFGQAEARKSVVALAAYGQLGLALRLGGYKLFDLEQGTVLTSFSPAIHPNIVAQQIARASEAGKYAFAPTVLCADTSQRWYQESYIQGHRLPPLFLNEAAIETHFFSLLMTLITSKPPQRLSLLSYASHLKEVALGADKGLSNLALASRPEQVQRVRAFVEKTWCDLVDELVDTDVEVNKIPSAKVVIVLSHGDLHEQNVLQTDKGLKLIDWNNLNQRSLFYDLYTLLFRGFRSVQAFWSAQPATLHPPSKLRALVAQFRTALSADHPGIDTTLSDRQYRRLFYLEFVCKGTEKLWEKPSDSGVQARLEHLVAWIENFERYEAEVKHEATG
jgi:Phosphotransferase enzyme family